VGVKTRAGFAENEEKAERHTASAMRVFRVDFTIGLLGF